MASTGVYIALLFPTPHSPERKVFETTAFDKVIHTSRDITMLEAFPQCLVDKMYQAQMNFRSHVT